MINKYLAKKTAAISFNYVPCESVLRFNCWIFLILPCFDDWEWNSDQRVFDKKIVKMFIYIKISGESRADHILAI